MNLVELSFKLQITGIVRAPYTACCVSQAMDLCLYCPPTPHHGHQKKLYVTISFITIRRRRHNVQRHRS